MHTYMCIVGGLASLWKKGLPRKGMEATIFTLPSDHEEMKSFIEKYDKNQKRLQTLAAMDDLLSGMWFKLCALTEA